MTHNWKLSRLITCFCRSRKLVNCVYIYHIGILTMRHQSFYNTSTTSLHFVAENYLSGVKFGSMFLALSCYMTNNLQSRSKMCISPFSLHSFLYSIATFYSRELLSGVKFGSMFLDLSCYMKNDLQSRSKICISPFSLHSFSILHRYIF